MPRFFVTASQIGLRDDGRKTVLILGDDAAHITRSLRMKEGENITVCDMAGREYLCKIISLKEAVCALVESERAADSEPPYRAVLYQALVKGDKFDTVVQKAVECGVSEIVPILTERCVTRLDKSSCAKKTVRWQRIADEAAKQCGRGTLVKIRELMTFKEAVSDAAKCALPLFCYEGESSRTLPTALRTADRPESISVVIGSEGGFSQKEASVATDAGLISVGLGKRILRTETASSFVLACLSFNYELQDR